jgi:membrane protease YdiL (CAAX protease family)
MAAPVLFRVFEEIYSNPVPRIPMQTLGIIMWYRTGILAVLVLRRMEGIGFGLLPRRLEWAIGLKNFALFLPLGFVAAYALEFVRPAAPELTLRLLANAVLYFVATLWFLAVAEEFFFRGLLQQLLSRVLRSEVAGLVMASILFGLVHLGFRNFPNWRFALLAAIAGLFYGRAYLQAASIRAAMVTHALVVTLWRVFLA